MLLCRDCGRYYATCKHYGRIKNDLKCRSFVPVESVVYKLRLWMYTYIAIITAVIVVVVFLLLK
jgi:hypothetical protein